MRFFSESVTLTVTAMAKLQLKKPALTRRDAPQYSPGQPDGEGDTE
ncbi:hypothetical protein [Paenochrobactrum glaciei]